MTRRYQVITFDMGYTLVDMDSFGEILQPICAARGIKTDIAALDRAVDAVWEEVMRQDATTAYAATADASRAWWREVNQRTLEAASLPRESWHGIEEEFMAGVDDPANYAVFSDAIPTLTALRGAGYRLGVVSNWGWNLPDLCDAWGITPLVDFVVTSARVGYAKPNPRIFHEAIRQGEAAPSAMLHVGDSHYADVGGARGAGIDAVWLNRAGKAAPTDCRTVTNLHEVLPLLGLAGEPLRS